MKSVLVYSLCLVMAAPLWSADAPPLRGYSNESSRVQQDWETKFRALPDPAGGPARWCVWRRINERTADRVRERQPLLPALVAHVDERYTGLRPARGRSGAPETRCRGLRRTPDRLAFEAGVAG